MSSLGVMLVKHAVHCGSTQPEACDLLEVTLRGIVSTYGASGEVEHYQIVYVGLPLPGTQLDLLVLRQGRFREQRPDPLGDHRQFESYGPEVWIPVDSILTVALGGAS